MLYVDDEPMLLEVSKEFLEMEGDLVIDGVPSGRKALDALKGRRYEVLVSDYQMPGMDGIELLKAVRESGDDIPFVLFTGRGREEVAIDALNAGADFYLQKGGDPSAQFGELRHVIIQLAQRRRAERAFAEGDEKLRLITDNMSDVVTQVDLSGVVQYVSPSVRSILGYRPEELVGRAGDRLIHPDDLPGVQASLEEAARSGAPTKREYRFLRGDGKYVWVETSGNFLFGSDGRPTGMVITTRDITSRKEAQERLEQSERKYRDLIESSSSIVVRMDRRGKISYVNDFACRFFGFSRDDLVGHNVVGTIVESHDGGGRDMDAMIAGIIRDPSAYSSNINENVRKDGSRVWVAWMNKKVDLGGGDWEVLSTGVDITRQHMAEMDRERTASLLRATLDSTADGVLVVDLGGQVQALNRRAADALGIDEGALAASSGRTVWDLVKERAADPSALLAKAEDMRPHAGGSTEDLVKMRDGRTYQLTTRPQRLEGRTIGRVWSFHDITPLVVAEEAVVEREARLSTIYQSTVIGIVVASSDRSITDANQAFLDMLGYTLEELRGKRIEEVTFAEDRDKDLEPLGQILRGEIRSYQVEKRYVRKDGTLVWGRATVAPLKGLREGRGCLTATVENIDEWKKVRERLGRIEGAFDTLADNYPNGTVAVYDQDLRYIRVGGAGLELLGLDRGAMEGKTVAEVLPPANAEDAERIYRKALEGAASVGEASLNGRTLLTMSFPVTDEGGRVFAGMNLTQDITDRKANEVSLARANRSLRVLIECNQALVRAQDEQGLLKEVCNIITTFGGYSLAWVGWAGKSESKAIHPVAWAGPGQGYMDGLSVTYDEGPRGQGPGGVAMRTGAISVVTDLWTDERFQAWGDRAREHGLHACIGLPLSHHGRAVGVLLIYSGEPGAFDREGERELLSELAADLSYGLANIRQQAQRARSEKALARRGEQLERLALATQRLNSVLDSDAILDTLVSSAMDVVGATAGMAGLMKGGRMVYTRINRRGRVEPIDVSFCRGEGVTGHVMDSLQPYLTNHPETDPYVIPSLREEIGYYNLAIAPVIDRGGRLMGCFWMQNKPGGGFDAGDLEALRSLAAGASVALENARMVGELRAREASLEQANRKLNLIGRITRHDLLNQLTSLNGYIEIARMKEADEGVRALLDKALRSGENIDKHLAFARDYQEMGTARPAWVSVKGAVVKGTSTVNLGPISLSLEVDGVEVLADRMLEKVFHNLADDSVRHGRTVRRVRITCAEAKGGLSIVYEDDGVGVPAEKKASIFEMTSGHHGLYMAREILGITGMTIREVGREGEGACFVITVPPGNYRLRPATP